MKVPILISAKTVAEFGAKTNKQNSIGTNLSILPCLGCLSYETVSLPSEFDYLLHVFILSSELNHPINELLGVIEHVATY